MYSPEELIYKSRKLMRQHGKLTVYAVSARIQCPHYRGIYDVCFVWLGPSEFSELPIIYRGKVWLYVPYQVVSGMWTASAQKLAAFFNTNKDLKWTHEKKKSDVIVEKVKRPSYKSETIVIPVIVFLDVWVSCWPRLPSPSSSLKRSKRRIDDKNRRGEQGLGT